MEMLGYIILCIVGVVIGHFVACVARTSLNIHKQLKKCEVQGVIQAEIIIAEDSKWYNPKIKIVARKDG